MARLFLAVWPPPHVVDALAALLRADRPGVRYVRAEQWHVTVRFLGEAQPGEVIDALDGLELPAATARLGPRVTRLFKGIVGVPVDGLDELAAATSRATESLGDPPSARFVGHLTLARVKSRADASGLSGVEVRAEFEVREVVLVESRIDQRGATYESLTSWPAG